MSTINLIRYNFTWPLRTQKVGMSIFVSLIEVGRPIYYVWHYSLDWNTNFHRQEEAS